MSPRTIPGIILAVYTLLIAAVTLYGFFPVIGIADYTRAALALLGIMGAMLLFFGSAYWKPLLICWSIAQIPIIIVDPSGDLTRQCIFLGISSTESHSVNGLITSMTGFGINFWGVALLVATLLIARHSRKKTQPQDSTLPPPSAP